ncbi:hypothetical protein [Shewanella colwelliana]|uniref:hypothetical protein n=1 Tax=Shewanella colwelliana TaxID=23 RepID=UPI000491A7B5|nr:hypothetical protein [Shewanella colwelliana]
MKKALVAAAVIAIGAGAYWATQNGTEQQPGHAALAYVPADTPVFSAQFTPFPLKDYIDSIPDAQKQYPQELQALMQDENEPRAKFFFGLFNRYMQGMKDGQTFVTTFGLPEDLTSYFYTLGALPVLKLDIANPEVFWALLDSIEAESGLNHEMRKLAQVDYRAYPLTESGEEEQIDLVFAIDNGMLTITLATSFSDPALLETALGIKPVTNPISESGIIEDIFAKHGFLKDGVSYINHQELVKAITTQDGNQLAKQLTHLFTMVNDDPFVELRSEVCNRELNGIAANWPRTVMGYTEFAVKDKQTTMGFSTVIESNNQVIMGALSQIRGFLPAYTQDVKASVFSMGLGVDVNQFVPAISKVWDDLLTPQYECAPLQQMQAQMQGQSPAMLGMFTGMANGVKGLSMSLMDYELSDATQQIELKGLDAIVTLSADDPATLFNMVKPFAPELANVQLPSDGSAIDLSAALGLPPTLGVSAKMAVKGNHLAVYSGEKSQAIAEALTAEPLTSNGLVTMSADYGKMFKPMMTLMEMSGEPVPPEFESLKDYNMKLKVDMDVNAQGIVIDSWVQTHQ